MGNHQISRRTFLGTAGMAATATFMGMGASLLNSGTAFAATPFVRRNISSLTASSSVIVSFKTAIAARSSATINIGSITVNSRR